MRTSLSSTGDDDAGSELTEDARMNSAAYQQDVECPSARSSTSGAAGGHPSVEVDASAALATGVDAAADGRRKLDAVVGAPRIADADPQAE
jgi:hypothetical protein